MSFSHAYGALLGVLCADAAGATLEMECEAMRMPGGGISRVGPGQITDDSELALSLARALVDHTPSDTLPLDAIVQRYYDCWRSKPCDIGNTCRNAFAIPDVI